MIVAIRVVPKELGPMDLPTHRKKDEDENKALGKRMLSIIKIHVMAWLPEATFSLCAGLAAQIHFLNRQEHSGTNTD